MIALRSGRIVRSSDGFQFFKCIWEYSKFEPNSIRLLRLSKSLKSGVQGDPECLVPIQYNNVLSYFRGKVTLPTSVGNPILVREASVGSEK
eukprot:1191897-Prorocentrum_minimum.AAC.2